MDKGWMEAVECVLEIGKPPGNRLSFVVYLLSSLVLWKSDKDQVAGYF